MFALDKRTLAVYPGICTDCYSLQQTRGDFTVLCEVHSVAHKLQKQSLMQPAHTKQPESENCASNQASAAQIPLSSDKMEFVKDYLRNGRHHKLQGERANADQKGRRMRHNSVEQLMQTVLCIEEDPDLNETMNSLPLTDGTADSAIEDDSPLDADCSTNTSSQQACDAKEGTNHKSTTHINIQRALDDSRQKVLKALQHIQK